MANGTNNLPAGWEAKSLGEVAQVKGGKRVPKGYKLQAAPTDHPYISVKDFNEDGSIDANEVRFVSDDVFEQISRYTVSSRDVYISIAGTIGKSGIVPPELDGANLTENACKLVLDEGAYPRFIYFFTRTESFREQAGSRTRVAAQPKLALSRLATIEIPLPPLTEQERIVGILDEAFEGIAAATANAEKNLQNARELFQSVLGSTFSQKGDDWEEAVFSELCRKITVGYVSSMKRHYRTTGISFLRSQNIRPFAVNTKNLMFVDSDFEATITKSRLFPGDVAIVRTGYPGTAAVIPEWLGEANCSDLVIVRPKEVIDPHFIVAFFNSPVGRRMVGGRLVGAAQKHFNVAAAKRTLFPFPPLSSQKAIVEKLDALSEETKRLETIYERKKAALAELKQSLLQKAFSGQL
ncbi:restriction endonuclease subunit S [bacterium]|nr:restriction endonuclease subunit S [bacterium]